MAPTSGIGFAEGSALSKLKAAANLEPVKKVVTLNDGSELEMWVSPLVAQEKDRARSAARGKDGTDDSDWLYHLLVAKAKDGTGKPLFSIGEIPELKRNVRDADLQAVINAIYGLKDDAVEIDVKKLPAS